MTLNSETFTDKTSSILSKASDLAREFGHSALAPIHIFSALFDDQAASDGFFKSIVSKAGADPVLVERRAKAALVKLPSQSPAPDSISLSNASLKVNYHSPSVHFAC